MRIVQLYIIVVISLLLAGCLSPFDGQNSTATGTIPHVSSTSAIIKTTLSPTVTPAAVPIASTPPSTDSVSKGTAGGGILKISVLDVGQGDSILVQLPGGKTMLVDAGDTGEGSRVVSMLRGRGVSSLDAAVASHGHADHIGGYQAVLSSFPVGVFYDSGYPVTSATYERLLTTIDQRNIRYVTPTQGQTINLDPNVRIDVLSPDGSNKGDIHDNMLVLRLTYGTFSALLAGDMPSTLEDDIAPSLQPTTLLKVAHHGSKTSTSKAFLDTIQPKIAIISVGADNPYGYPKAEVMQRLREAGTTIYRTDLDGTVTVSTDGTIYTVTTGRARNPPGGAEPVLTAAPTKPQTISSAGGAVAPVMSSAVAITALDLKGETVTITNGGPLPISLSGWRLTDEGAKHVYTFAGTTLPQGGSITVASGSATGDITWKTDNVWNNNGDTAYLYDGSGKLISRKGG
jgi:beta-lactamase superfamily II metal-dependent hydrolase